ncbi:MAG: hypothetical protein ACLQDY_27535 [Streptosporangiaceae bacterium]
MSWAWLNLPPAGVIFLAIVGVPLWMAIQHPDNRPSFDTVPAGTLGTAFEAGAPDEARTSADRWNREPERVRPVADRPLRAARQPHAARRERIPARNPSGAEG